MAKNHQIRYGKVRYSSPRKPLLEVGISWGTGLLVALLILRIVDVDDHHIICY